jgi:hypothetical protein
MKLTFKQLEKLVEQKYSLVKALRKHNPGERYEVGQTCFCPFHDNENTPAAAIYEDEGKQSLYCFSERKLYTVVDVFKQLINYDVYELGNYLWHGMSDYEKSEWLKNNSEIDPVELFSKKKETVETNKELEKARANFKYGKISLNELLEEYTK